MIDEAFILGIVRFVIGIGILSYASFTDIKTRRAPNILWIIMAGTGGILLLIQYITIGFENILYLVFIPILIALVYVFFQMRMIFGGADAKAIMALAILLPFWPSLGELPLWKSYLPFSWVIFANAIVLFLFIPLSLLLFNVSKRDVQFPHSLLGYKMSVEKARQKFVWPLERIKEGERKFSYMPKQFDIEEELKEFEQASISEIWVTPKIPFMIPLLAGFIASFLVGDLLFQFIQLLF